MREPMRFLTLSKMVFGFVVAAAALPNVAAAVATFLPIFDPEPQS